MRYDILNIAAEAHRVHELLQATLGATVEPNRFGPKSHLKTPNGGRLHVSPSLTNESQASVSLYSDLDDAAHNAWTVEVFNAACRVTDSDVDLFDDEDRVVQSRHRKAA